MVVNRMHKIKPKGDDGLVRSNWYNLLIAKNHNPSKVKATKNNLICLNILHRRLGLVA